MSAVLQTQRLGKTFAGFVAVQDLHLVVEDGARHALIGPNGAGKTTAINLLSGFLEPTAGEVFLVGENITRLAQHKRVKRGLVRTFQLHELASTIRVAQHAQTLTLPLELLDPFEHVRQQLVQLQPARQHAVGVVRRSLRGHRTLLLRYREPIPGHRCGG